MVARKGMEALMARGEARELRNMVRKRLREAQRRFADGWQVPISAKEAKAWEAAANMRLYPLSGPAEDGTYGRPYLVGDVACLVLACKDLLEDAYGRSLSLRVGQGVARRSKKPQPAAVLHAAIMMGDACLAELMLDWQRAEARGLGPGRRALKRFMGAALAAQAGGPPPTRRGSRSSAGSSWTPAAVPGGCVQLASGEVVQCTSMPRGASGRMTVAEPRGRLPRAGEPIFLPPATVGGRPAQWTITGVKSLADALSPTRIVILDVVEHVHHPPLHANAPSVLWPGGGDD